jgi:hypothetical protein
VYEPIAANIARRLTAQTATSAPPDALVLPGPARHPRAVVASLRGLAACGLVRLASRLDPDASASWRRLALVSTTAADGDQPPEGTP